MHVLCHVRYVYKWICKLHSNGLGKYLNNNLYFIKRKKNVVDIFLSIKRKRILCQFVCIKLMSFQRKCFNWTFLQLPIQSVIYLNGTLRNYHVEKYV